MGCGGSLGNLDEGVRLEVVEGLGRSARGPAHLDRGDGRGGAQADQLHEAAAAVIRRGADRSVDRANSCRRVAGCFRSTRSSRPGRRGWVRVPTTSHEMRSPEASYGRFKVHSSQGRHLLEGSTSRRSFNAQVACSEDLRQALRISGRARFGMPSLTTCRSARTAPVRGLRNGREGCWKGRRRGRPRRSRRTGPRSRA